MQAGVLPGSLPGVTFSVTGELFNLSSFALSLLLVFRTNASYDRWLEARLIWGGIINRSRDLVRQVRKLCSPGFPLKGVTDCICHSTESSAWATVADCPCSRDLAAS